MPFVVIILSSKMYYARVMRELKEYQGSSRALHSYCCYNNNASSNDDDVSLCLRERSNKSETKRRFDANKSESLFVVFLVPPSFCLTSS